MLETKELQNIDKNYHWVLRIPDYPHHPLQEVIKDFTPNTRDLFNCSYLYIGELNSTSKKNNIICILHFHSDLKGPVKFMNIQNLESYKYCFGLTPEEIFEISQNITRETVIDLKYSDALTKWHLDKINNASYFYLVDETGFAKGYNTGFFGG